MSAATAVLRRFRFSREVVLLGVLVVLMVVMSLLSPLFLTVGNLLNTSRFFVEVGLMALGMTLIIITGGIDLSVGSNLALVSVAVGFSYAAGLPLPLAIVFGLVVGFIAGLFNGLFITLLDLHPLVVTLGTFALFQGLAYGLSEAEAVSDFPGWFAYFGQAYFLNVVPGQLFIFIVAVVVVWLILSRTRFGRYVYAIGNNEEAAHFSGVPVRKVKLALYSGIGLLVGMAAVIYTSRVYTARGDSGLGRRIGDHRRHRARRPHHRDIAQRPDAGRGAEHLDSLRARRPAPRGRVPERVFPEKGGVTRAQGRKL
jgi:rhamnose transport system permease protein